jgi:deazaflavin-dependent oxidoreductase (nitroreductase family)
MAMPSIWRWAGPVEGLVRIVTTHVVNPVMTQLAGRRYSSAALIRHTGRRSGRVYATPVVAEPVTDGFLVPLPYGTGVDWLQNVLVSGGARVDLHGARYEVTEPRVLSAAQALQLVDQPHRQVWRMFRIRCYLLLRTVPPQTSLAPNGTTPLG